MDKRGQVTIFIIIGIILVAGIITFIVLSKGDISSIINPGKGASINSVTSCIEDVINEKYPVVMENGGKANPVFYVSYNGVIHNYLCYTDDLFTPCVNYYPLLKESVAREIVDASSEEVEQCFTTFIKEYERQGYSASIGDTNSKITFVDNILYLDVEKKIVFTQENNTEVFEDFEISIPTKSSQLLDTAGVILNDEAEFCTFDEGNYMVLYPEISIFKTGYEDGATLYQLNYRETGEEFNFAVRSCILPE